LKLFSSGEIGIFKNYFLATRPKTLIIAISVWLTGWGLSTALWEQAQFTLNLIILICMLLLQIAVNYFNDVLDFKRKKDTAERLGPPRMVQSRKIQPSSLMRVSYAILFSALCLGIYLVIKGGSFILIIGFIALGMTYFYSAPPIALADRGLSELFVFLFFGILAVSGICHLNVVQISSTSSFFHPAFIQEIEAILTAGAQMGFLSVSLLIINHLRDHQEDQKRGKKTWVVRKGRKFGLAQWLTCISLTYLLGVYWMLTDSYFTAGTLPLFILPLHIYIFQKIFQEKPSKKYNTFLALNSLGQFLFSITLFLGYCFSL